ncbi:hypothetical protein VAWG001_12980 [Aeromonas dhakensis]|nr:hypothetical protein VAWG001_12980 [Aeromonas dhakensis]
MGQLKSSANSSTNNRFTFITPKVIRITILRQTRQDRGLGNSPSLDLPRRRPLPEVQTGRGREGPGTQAG